MVLGFYSFFEAILYIALDYQILLLFRFSLLGMYFQLAIYIADVEGERL